MPFETIETLREKLKITPNSEFNINLLGKKKWEKKREKFGGWVKAF